MIVKRGAFLVLTSVLAHQACVVDDSDDDSSTGGEAGESGSGGSSSAGKGGSGGSQAGAGAEGGDAGASGGQGGAEDGGAGGATSAGMGGEAGDNGGAGGEPGCDDSVGTPGDCTQIDASTCSWERGYCEAAGVNLKPGVAEAATTCMLATADCGADFYGCVRTALAGACPDASRDAFCTDAVTACDPQETITMAECHALIDGLNETGLAEVESCVDGGCTFGLWSCVEGVQ